MSTTLNFFINRSKENSQTKRSPIYLRILHQRKKAEGKISLTPVPKEFYRYWNIKTQRFNSDQKQFTSYNLLLNKLENEFHNYIREHNADLSIIRPQDIRDHLLGKNKKDQIFDLITSIENYYKKDIRLDSDKAIGTKKNYRKSINHFCKFLKHNRIGSIRPEEFSRAHAQKFLNYLKQPNPKVGKIALKGQSINGIIKNIKPYFTKLQYEDRITLNPFVGIRASEKKSVKPRLSNKDFKKILKLDLSGQPKLEVYRELFLFLCYTGLSYCDAIDLRKSDVENGYIQLYRKKSSIGTKQFLIKQSKAIIKKYEGQIPENRILPKRSLDKLNLNLKLIAVMVGIKYNLTTYTARRFFRQSIHESGIREALVVKTMMGHTRSKDMDSHYLLIDDDMLKKAKKKLQKHFKIIEL